MTGTILACIIIPFYLFSAGYITSRILTRDVRTCHFDHERGDHLNQWGEHRCDHSLAYVIGIFWPIALPVRAGSFFGKQDRTTRLEKQRQKELEQAEHDTKMARLARQEAEELTLQLRALGKEAS